MDNHVDMEKWHMVGNSLIERTTPSSCPELYKRELYWIKVEKGVLWEHD